MPVFFISSGQVEGSRITLRDSLFSHLQKSLRVRVGDHLCLCDEYRKRYVVEISQLSRTHMIGDIQSIQDGPNPEHPRMILGQAILKGEKMTWVIQKGTELGADIIVPLITNRVIARVQPHDAKKACDRWQRIALEAAQQAERWEIPQIHELVFAHTLWGKNSPVGFNLMLVERQSSPPLSKIPFPDHWDDDFTILVGPEGGWTEDELVYAQAAGFKMTSLGDRILRAETAAMAALTVVQSRLGRL